jgi:thiol-disulfide isomerase/thioredoxin
MRNTSLAALSVLALGFLYGIGTLAVHAAPAMPQPLAAPKAVKAAPAVVFYDASGTRHALSQYKGHYVLMNFWATWCAPCVAELPALAKLKAAVPGVTVLAVDTTGRAETAQVAQAFLKSHNAAALEPMVDKDVMMMKSFTLYGMPTTVLLDPKGQEIARAVGPGEWDSPAMIGYLKGLK